MRLYSNTHSKMRATITRKRPRIATKEENADEYVNADGRYAYQKRTDYAVTLLNPFKMMQVRIPDLSCFPTGVYTQERNFIWPVSSAGAANNNQILVVYFGAGNSFYNFYQGDANNPSFGQMTNGTWAPGILDGGIETRYVSSRLVSAGVRIKFTGNDNNNQGTLSVVPAPRSLVTAPAAALSNNIWNTANMGALNQVPGALLAPITSGAVYRYQPQDATAFQMNDCYSLSTQLDDVPCYAAVIIATSGLSATSSFIVEIAATWEGICANTNNGTDAAKGPADPVAQAFGMDQAGRAANVFTVESERMNIDAPIRQVLRGY